jgi:hypothetical protein
MIWRDIDERVLLVPGREVGVDVGFYGAERAGDEGEDAGDFELGVFGRVVLAFSSFRGMGGGGERSTS